MARIHRYAANDQRDQLSASNLPSPQISKQKSAASISVQTNPSASNPLEGSMSHSGRLPAPSLPAQLARIPPHAQDHANGVVPPTSQHPTDEPIETRLRRSSSFVSAPLRKMTSSDHQARLDESGPKLMPGMVSNAERQRRRQSITQKRQSFAEPTHGVDNSD